MDLLPSPFKVPSVPGTPFYALSPERINQQRLPQSPSLPSQLSSEVDRKLQHYNHNHHHQRSSDVQAKVAFLNSLSSGQGQGQVQGSSQNQSQGASHAHIPAFSPSRKQQQQSSQQSSESAATPQQSKTTTTTTTTTMATAAAPVTANHAHAALQRAILGREEAEASLSTVSAALSESQIRERKISERVESLMEELAGVRERQVHERAVFEKEVRRARKEAFKAGSGLVAVQEELKEARAESGRWRKEVEREKAEKEKARQEAFERAYVVAGLMEEVEALRAQVKAKAKECENVEENRKEAEDEEEGEGLAMEKHVQKQQKKEMRSFAVQTEVETEIRQEDLESIGMKSTPETQSADATPKAKPQDNCCQIQRTLSVLDTSLKSSTSKVLGSDSFTSASENPTLGEEDLTQEEQIVKLKAQLQWERKLRTRDEDLINFMQLQCQFKACPCRVAEKMGQVFVHDREYEVLKRKRTELMEGERERKRKLGEVKGKNLPVENGKRPAEKDDKVGHKQRNESKSSTRLPVEESDPKRPKDIVQREQQQSETLPEQESTPEPTAVLEDMTQLLIQPEPVTSTKLFCSKSVSSSNDSTNTNVDFRASVPTIRNKAPIQTDDLAADPNHERGLFDLSPPRQVPARPSTALGVSTEKKIGGYSGYEGPHHQRQQQLQSPIKMIAASPKELNLKPGSNRSRAMGAPVRPVSAMDAPSSSAFMSQTSRKVAVKRLGEGDAQAGIKATSPNRRPLNSDSIVQKDKQPASPREARTQRHKETDLQEKQHHQRSTTASPNVPATPIVHLPTHRHQRTQSKNPQLGLFTAGTVSRNAPTPAVVSHPSSTNITTTTTTTTMVPLRGLEPDADDDVFSPPHLNSQPLPRTPATASKIILAPGAGGAVSHLCSRSASRAGPLGGLNSARGNSTINTTHLRGGSGSDTSNVDGDSNNNNLIDPMALNLPGTPISRQEALRQIRERRDRARSVNLSTSGLKKSVSSLNLNLSSKSGGLRVESSSSSGTTSGVGNVTGSTQGGRIRRDSRDGDGDGNRDRGLKSAPASVRRGIHLNMNMNAKLRDDIRDRDRDFSAASAPGRI